nr:MAG TPA: hypothetical protein [Caudoviricetes sp.]
MYRLSSDRKSRVFIDTTLETDFPNILGKI